MKIIRYTIDNISDTTANELCGNSFFASKNFMRLWESVGGTPVYWAVREEDNIVGLLPGIEFGNSPVKRFQAMPDGCYGTVLLEETVYGEDPIELLFQSVKNFGYTKTYFYDFSHKIRQDIGYESQQFETMLIDVSNPDWEPPDKKLQSEIRKANREDVQIEKFDRKKNFESFIELMKQTEARHDRKPKYPDIFFQQLAMLAESDERILWYWCESEGKPVCSHINFIESDMVINWQVYYDKEFSFLKANQKALFDMAKSLRMRGIKYLNLGASPDEAESLKDYKVKWGGELHRYPCYVYKSLLGNII